MKNIQQVLISVVIPTFNHAEYLRKAISSVINQTYKNFEVIIIDNHSTDHTREVIESFGDSRIRYLKFKNKGVIASSRNKGINESSGDWIAFLDSDDFWYKERLARVVNILEERDTFDVITTDEIVRNLDDHRIRRVLRYTTNFNNFYKKMLLYGNRLSTSAVCVRKEFLTMNNILFDERKEFITVEDYDLWLRISLNGAKFKSIRSIQGEYSIHEGNSSSRENIHRTNGINLLREHIFNIQNFDKDKEKLWSKINSRFNFNFSLKEIRKLNLIEGLKSMTVSFSKSPLFLSSYILFIIYIKTSSFIFSIFRK